jgi:hypothetical protein
VFLILAGLMVDHAAAQAPFAAEPQRNSRPSNANPPPTQEKRPFAAQPARSADAERCRNYRRQLKQVERRQSEAITTGERDQFVLQRQSIVEQQQRAGC